MASKIIGILVLVIVLCTVVVAANNKKINCQINGVAINQDLIGVNRVMIIAKFGQPEYSALDIKGFEEYSFAQNNKAFAVILRYEYKDDVFYVSNYQCLKAKAKLELFNRVIWH